MPIRISEARITPQRGETLEELTERTHSNLCAFSARHTDYTAIIEQYIDEGYIIVKSLMLKESAN